MSQNFYDKVAKKFGGYGYSMPKVTFCPLVTFSSSVIGIKAPVLSVLTTKVLASLSYHACLLPLMITHKFPKLKIKPESNFPILSRKSATSKLTGW